MCWSTIIWELKQSKQFLQYYFENHDYFWILFAKTITKKPFLFTSVGVSKPWSSLPLRMRRCDSCPPCETQQLAMTLEFTNNSRTFNETLPTTVSEMVQNSQSLYSFTFNALFITHEYIYSHSTTKFLFKKYIYSHLTTYFLFTKIFTHIYGCIYSHSTVYNRSLSQSKHGTIFIQHFRRTPFAHH